jgi:hypothetical protein
MYEIASTAKDVDDGKAINVEAVDSLLVFINGWKSVAFGSDDGTFDLLHEFEGRLFNQLRYLRERYGIND